MPETPSISEPYDETVHNPELPKEPIAEGAGESTEPTSQQLAEVCSDILPLEDCADLAAMPFDEALGYAYTLLLEQGEDADTILTQAGIIETEITQDSELRALPVQLGFTETDELVVLRERLIDAMQNDSHEADEIAGLYADTADATMQQYSGDVSRSQIGLIIQQAVIARDGGDAGAFAYHLEAARDLAQYLPGMDALVDLIDKALEDPWST